MLPQALLGGGMKYSVEVNRVACISCGVCYNTDPSHYESDAEGKSMVIDGTTNGVSSGTFDDGLIDDARRAESSCPMNAIIVKE
jgi:ferredoxin